MEMDSESHGSETPIKGLAGNKSRSHSAFLIVAAFLVVFLIGYALGSLLTDIRLSNQLRTSSLHNRPESLPSDSTHYDSQPLINASQHEDASSDSHKATECQAIDLDSPYPIVSSADLLAEAQSNDVAFISKWQGQGIVVTGPIKEISTGEISVANVISEKRYCIKLEAGSGIFDIVECYFDSSYTDHDFLHLLKGQSVYIEAYINRNSIYDDFTVCVFDCRLLFPLESDIGKDAESAFQRSQSDSVSGSGANDELHAGQQATSKAALLDRTKTKSAAQLYYSGVDGDFRKLTESYNVLDKPNGNCITTYAQGKIVEVVLVDGEYAKCKASDRIEQYIWVKVEMLVKLPPAVQ